MSTCETCRFRGEPYTPPGPVEIADHYKCRRHSPVVTGGMMSDVATVWPSISLTDWCGDHAPILNPEPTAKP